MTKTADPFDKRRSPQHLRLLRGFYTIREIAAAVEVSCRTVSRLIAHRLGRNVRIADDDLQAFLARRRGAYR